MSSLLDKDKTAAREVAYPNTAGNSLKQLIEPMVQAHLDAGQKYIEWVQELLKLPEVSFATKMAILGGEDPLTFGASMPAAMMSKLEALGVAHGKISGGMIVSETNKASELAKTGVQSQTNAGVGTAFWNVNEQLNVQHATRSTEARDTDYRAHIDWEVELAPQGEAEGIKLIKESVARVFTKIMKINEKLADKQLEDGSSVVPDPESPPTEDDAEKFMAKSDYKPLSLDELLDNDDDTGDANGNGDGT